MVGGCIVSSCQWKYVDKRKHERGLCHHVRVYRNQSFLTSITCEGLSLRRGYLTVYFGKLKIVWCHVPKECKYQRWRQIHA